MINATLKPDENGLLKNCTGQMINSYKVNGILGEGSFGRVFRAQNANGEFALKAMLYGRQMRQVVDNELNVLKKIADYDEGDTCIKLVDSFAFGDFLFLAFPLMAMSVDDWIFENECAPIQMDDLRQIVFQLCKALKFLHSIKIAHTDLKPANILIVDSSFTTSFNNGKRVRRLNSTKIKLCDFGNARMEPIDCNHLITSPFYRPPEVVLGLVWNETCDIWSAGCVIFELYTGQNLFPASNSAELLAMMEKIIGRIPSQMVQLTQIPFFINGKINFDWANVETHNRKRCKPLKKLKLASNECDNQLISVLEQMLVLNPSQRIAFDEVLNHPFFHR